MERAHRYERCRSRFKSERPYQLQRNINRVTIFFRVWFIVVPPMTKTFKRGITRMTKRVIWGICV
jgi:hypothetical protein